MGQLRKKLKKFLGASENAESGHKKRNGRMKHGQLDKSITIGSMAFRLFPVLVIFFVSFFYLQFLAIIFQFIVQCSRLSQLSQLLSTL